MLVKIFKNLTELYSAIYKKNICIYFLKTKRIFYSGYNIIKNSVRTTLCKSNQFRDIV